jgi:hypothetical protein
MKLKIVSLLTAGLAGAAASAALADHGDHGSRNGCQKVHLNGTLAAGSLSLTVNRSNHDGPAKGTALAVAVQDGTRANVEACVTGTGTSATFTLRGAELHFRAPKPAQTAKTQSTETQTTETETTETETTATTS